MRALSHENISWVLGFPKLPNPPPPTTEESKVTLIFFKKKEENKNPKERKGTLPRQVKDTLTVFEFESY